MTQNTFGALTQTAQKLLNSPILSGWLHRTAQDVAAHEPCAFALALPRAVGQVRDVMRLHHYSIHTERSYVGWTKRYIHFHHMRSREEPAGGESKIEAFLTHLAVQEKVSASTQN